jgi:chaperonin cofactor prefoldin
VAQGGERRMLFDIRGRRKHVVRVVYAILALLMGASLFLVVGPFNIGNLIGNSSSSDAGKLLDEQAARIEQRLATDPNNEDMLVSLIRTRIAASKAKTEVNPETGLPQYTTEGVRELLGATQAWQRYKKVAQEVNPSAAALMAGAFFGLAETAGSIEEADANVEAAASAQRIAAEARPSLGTLSNLAIFEYYAGDFAAGNAAAKQAAAKAPKGEAKQVEKQMAEYRKRGKLLEKQKAEFAKTEESQRKESLENPFGGLGGGGGTTLGG